MICLLIWGKRYNFVAQSNVQLIKKPTKRYEKAFVETCSHSLLHGDNGGADRMYK